MTNHEGGAITIDIPSGGFEAVQGIVTGIGNSYRTSNGPESERLSLKQDFVLQQIASEGVLDLLAQMNVDCATALMTDLKVKIEADPYADMVAVESGAQNSLAHMNFEREKRLQVLDETEDQTEEEVQIDESAILQLEEQIVLEQRYARLAEAVGATARATVAILTGGNQEAAQASLARGRKIVVAAAEPTRVGGVPRIGTSIGSVAESALSSMLDKLENPPLAQLG